MLLRVALVVKRTSSGSDATTNIYSIVMTSFAEAHSNLLLRCYSIGCLEGVTGWRKLFLKTWKKMRKSWLVVAFLT